MDWNMVICSVKGHVTYAPDERPLHDRLQAVAPGGPAWRCLRCAVFVPGPPRGAGPADEAPQLLRGPALRDALILRLLAVERLFRGLLFLVLGYAVLRFERSEASLRELFERALPQARSLAQVFAVNLDTSSTVQHLRHVLDAKPHTLTLIAGGLFAYAAVEIVEAVGLWRLARWGEYFALVATAAFLPLEIYELVDRFTVVKIVIFALNVFAVVYLLVAKRLFGLRGGKAAYEAERHSESLLEIERAAAEQTG
ncbi:DUF2127 domain-containing protein [Kitasatospora sp. GP82]|uniref:DUF2127 domain-containing protein n=1 Tax=Kitasatospora sp. GP82 TaxID=3035089 RepID=UPI0024772430|nr:DUF2127 domain-containing protein [Kitasatospora sp. GP82]MDH6125879.1 uncharacterized membrane protein (DUF2068 family) [Kitasatospora sp. GP82]